MINNESETYIHTSTAESIFPGCPGGTNVLLPDHHRQVDLVLDQRRVPEAAVKLVAAR